MSTSAEQDQYVNTILTKYLPPAPNPQIKLQLEPMVRRWAGPYLLSMSYSGSTAKLTPVRGESDVDFFISLQTTMPLQDIYEGFFNFLKSQGLSPRKQNVSIRINYLGAEVDLTPGRLQLGGSGDCSLYVRRKNTWKQTNIATHISTVRGSGRTQEIRAIKIWRKCHRLDFPSFYLELTTIGALRGRPHGVQLAQNVIDTLGYIADNLVNARVVDPANTGNIISDDLTQPEKQAIASKAKESHGKPTWGEIIW